MEHRQHGACYIYRKMAATIIKRIVADEIIIKQPPPVIAWPIFLCRPDFVKGIPVLREIFCFAFAIPTALFHEKPPLFIESHPYLFWLKVYFILIECQVISANLFGVKERVFNLIILFLTFDYSISVLNCLFLLEGKPLLCAG